MTLIRHAVQLAVEVAPAGAVAGAVGVLGSLAAAPGWMLALGQAVVVVTWVLRGIDKRNAHLHSAVNEVRGELEVLRGRFHALPCTGGERPQDCPVDLP